MDRLLYDRALGLLARLDQHEVDYVLVGGLALACHELVRATQDIELFVRPTADNVERLRSALRQSWADPDIEEIRWEDLAGDYPAIGMARRESPSPSTSWPGSEKPSVSRTSKRRRRPWRGCPSGSPLPAHCIG